MEVLSSLGTMVAPILGVYLAFKIGDMFVRETFVYLTEFNTASVMFVIEVLRSSGSAATLPRRRGAYASVYSMPKETDDSVARLLLRSQGIALQEPTEEQKNRGKLRGGDVS